MRLRLMTVLLTGCVLGCVQPPQSPTFPPIPYFVYSVRHDAEPLALISKWYTGASENARALITHNPQLNPTAALSVGDQIRIPEMMLITRKAIPEEVFAKLKARVAKRPGGVVATPAPAKPSSKPAKATPVATPKSISNSSANSTPVASPTAKLEIFDSEMDQPAASVTPIVEDMFTPLPQNTTVPAAPSEIALSPEEKKIFEKSVQPAKPQSQKSTYEQMQEALGK